MIENKHLRSFLRVLDLGGFSRAARSLNIAQPALSQHVRKLEDQLGVALLIRGAQGVTPTRAGRQFATKARQILELVERAERQFQGGPDTLYGEVTLGLPGSVCPVLATPVIIAAKTRYPNIKLVVTELMSGDLADLLRDGRMDMAVLFNVSENEDFSTRELAVENLHIVGAPDDPLLQAAAIEADRIACLPLVGTRRPHGLRLLIDRWSAESGIALNFEVEADSPAVLTTMAARGQCYSILSPAAIQLDLKAGRLASATVTNPEIRRTVCLCNSKRLPPDTVRQAVFDLVVSVAEELLRDGNWVATSPHEARDDCA